VFAPAGTPRDVVEALARAFISAVQAADLKQRLLDQGEEPVGSSPEAFALRLRDEVARWTELVNATGIRAD